MKDANKAERQFVRSHPQFPRPDDVGLAGLGDVVTVCHPVWQLGCGGLERQLIYAANHLPRGAFRHVIVVRGWDESCDRAAASIGDHVHLVKETGPAADAQWSRRLAGILRKHDVDVLHVRGLSMLLDAVLAADSLGDTAVAFSFHGFESADNRPSGIRRKVYREAVLRCRDRWAVSASAAEALARMLNIPRNSIGVVENGVDTANYRPTPDGLASKESLDLPSDRLVFLSAGSLKPVKGHQVMLEAIQQLGDDAQRATFVLAGADYLDKQLHRWAVAHLADCDIRFVGRQADLVPWYQAADVFVLPSLWEGMSNALIEAMACGLPVIATRIGGNGDAVDEGATGLLVEPGDAGPMCEAMRRMMDDAPLRRAYGAAARDRAETDFDASAMLAEITRRYQRLAAPAETTETQQAKKPELVGAV